MSNLLQEGDRVVDDFEDTWTVIAIEDGKAWLEEEIIDRRHKTIALDNLRFYEQAEDVYGVQWVEDTPRFIAHIKEQLEEMEMNDD